MGKNDLDINEGIYSLRIKNMSGYMESCQFCGDKRCEGCPVPFSSRLTLKDLLTKLGVESNVSFFNDLGLKRGKQDITLEVVWNNRLEKSLFDCLQTAKS